MPAIKGTVKNHSSKTLWVLENDTQNHPVARKLGPKFKSPQNIDVDAFKRVDGKPIEGHRSWWKIWGLTTADIYDDGPDQKNGYSCYDRRWVRFKNQIVYEIDREFFID